MLEEFVTATRYSRWMLGAVFDEWRELDEAQRAEYVERRWDFVAGYGGPVANSRRCWTNGSTGAPRDYDFGPDWEEVYGAWNDCCFRGIHNRRLIHLKAVWADSMLFPGAAGQAVDVWEFELADGMQTRCCINLDLAQNRDLTTVVRQVAERGFRPVICVVPGVITSLGERFDAKALARYNTVINTTGCSPLRAEMEVVRAAGMDYRDTMRCWDGGASFFTCEHGNRHWAGLWSKIEYDDQRCLLSSDLLNLRQKFLRYPNGDNVVCTPGAVCPCGLRHVELDFAERVSPKVFLINGRPYSYERLRAAVIGGLMAQTGGATIQDYAAHHDRLTHLGFIYCNGLLYVFLNQPCDISRLQGHLAMELGMQASSVTVRVGYAHGARKPVLMEEDLSALERFE